MLAEGKLDHAKFTGYYETDFLSAGATSNNRQSNSYTMRQRQFWDRLRSTTACPSPAARCGASSPKPRRAFRIVRKPRRQRSIPNIGVGFSWARQYGFRVAKSFAEDKFILAFAVEGPQTTFGGRGVPNGKFFFNAPGAGGGLFNATDGTGYTVNQSPDFILKAALDPGWGHYEVFGVISRFRDRVFPCGVGISAANPCPLTVRLRTPSPVRSTIRAPVVDRRKPPCSRPRQVRRLRYSLPRWRGIGRYGSAQLATLPLGQTARLHPSAVASSSAR